MAMPDLFLAKPFPMNKLLASVRSLLPLSAQEVSVNGAT